MLLAVPSHMRTSVSLILSVIRVDLTVCNLSIPGPARQRDPPRGLTTSPFPGPRLSPAKEDMSPCAVKSRRWRRNWPDCSPRRKICPHSAITIDHRSSLWCRGGSSMRSRKFRAGASTLFRSSGYVSDRVRHHGQHRRLWPDEGVPVSRAPRGRPGRAAERHDILIGSPSVADAGPDIVLDEGDSAASTVPARSRNRIRSRSRRGCSATALW